MGSWWGKCLMKCLMKCLGMLMSSGKTHQKITTIGLVPVAIAAFGLGRFELLVGYIFSGWMLSPDLDGPTIHLRRWNAIGLGWMWKPYADALPHRSPWSHWPIIGTLGRFIYLGFWLALLMAMVEGICWYFGGPSPWMFVSSIQWDAVYLRVVWLFVGAEIAAATHYLADSLSTALRGSK
jgi:uncharacterized metal-binding protein